MKTKLMFIVLGVALVLVGLAGCVSGSPNAAPDIAPGIKAQIDAILSKPDLTAFERQVLSDYVVTDEEMAQAQQLFINCMADRGFSVTFNDNGSYSIGAKAGNSNTDSTAADMQCSVGTLNNIQPIWYSLKYNPQDLSMEMMTRACFQKYGITDGANLSDDAFTAMIDDPSYLPTDPQAALCVVDPEGSSTLTPDQALEMLRNGRHTAEFTFAPTPEPSATSSQ